MTTVEELRKKIEAQKQAGGKSPAAMPQTESKPQGSTVQSLRERAKSLPSQTDQSNPSNRDWNALDVAVGAFRAGEQIPETTGNLLGFLGEGLGLQAQEWGFNKVGTALREGGKTAQRVGKEITEAGMRSPSILTGGKENYLSEKEMKARKISGSIASGLLTGGASLGANTLGTLGKVTLGALDVAQGGIPGLGSKSVSAWTKAPASVTNPSLNMVQKAAQVVGPFAATTGVGAAQGMAGAAASQGTETSGTDLAVGAGVGALLGGGGSFLLGKGSNILDAWGKSYTTKQEMKSLTQGGRVINTSVGKVPMQMWSYLDYKGQKKVAEEVANMVGIKLPKSGADVAKKMQNTNIAMDAVYKHVVDYGDGVLAKDPFDFAIKVDNAMEHYIGRVAKELDNAGSIIDKNGYKTLLDNAKKAMNLSQNSDANKNVDKKINELLANFKTGDASELNKLANEKAAGFSRKVEKTAEDDFYQEFFKQVKDYIVENGARSVPGLEDTKRLAALHDLYGDVAKMAKKHAQELGMKEGMIQSTTNAYVLVNALKSMAGDPASIGNLQTSLMLKAQQMIGAKEKTMNYRLGSISDLYHSQAKTPDLSTLDAINSHNYSQLQKKATPKQLLLPAPVKGAKVSEVKSGPVIPLRGPGGQGDITSRSKIVPPKK